MSAHPSGLNVRAADLSLARPPRWAWNGRIVLGYLNLLLGNEGVGKGTLIAWMVAQLTHGRLPGDLHGKPVNVGVLGDEDSFDDVWTPRLHAAGADLGRVRLLERPDGGFVKVAEDRSKLTSAVRDEGLRVLFFDQLLDNLGAGTDDYHQKPVREALQPLRALARELDVAALGCLHPNKRAETFRQLVAGAPAFNAVSRSSLLLAAHPDNEDRRVLLRGKGNLSAKPTAIEFSVTGAKFEANGHTFAVPEARDFATSEMTMEDLLGRDVGGERSKIADAMATIRELLPKDGEWHAAKPILTDAGEAELDERTVQRAKDRLGVEHRRVGFPAHVEWRWPCPDNPRHPSDDVGAVASVGSEGVPSDASPDSPDSPDTETGGRHCDGTAPPAELEVFKPEGSPAAPCKCVGGPKGGGSVIDGVQHCADCGHVPPRGWVG